MVVTMLSNSPIEEFMISRSRPKVTSLRLIMLSMAALNHSLKAGFISSMEPFASFGVSSRGLSIVVFNLAKDCETSSLGD